MRNSPASFFFVGGEEGVVHRVSDLFDWTTDVLSESLLVANLFGQCSAGYEDNGLAEHLDLEDLACLLSVIYLHTVGGFGVLTIFLGQSLQ